MLSRETIERLQGILERRTGASISFEQAAEAADVYIGFFGTLLDCKPSKNQLEDTLKKW